VLPPTFSFSVQIFDDDGAIARRVAPIELATLWAKPGQTVRPIREDHTPQTLTPEHREVPKCLRA